MEETQVLEMHANKIQVVDCRLRKDYIFFLQNTLHRPPMSELKRLCLKCRSLGQSNLLNQNVQSFW